MPDRWLQVPCTAFAEDDGPSLLQTADNRGVVVGDIIGVECRSGLHRQPINKDYVLDSHRDTTQKCVAVELGCIVELAALLRALSRSSVAHARSSGSQTWTRRGMPRQALQRLSSPL